MEETKDVSLIDYWPGGQDIPGEYCFNSKTFLAAAIEDSGGKITNNLLLHPDNARMHIFHFAANSLKHYSN